MDVATFIKESVDIVTVISTYISLERVGDNYKGLCPFHEEKTPSFNVIRSKQFYYCFGCEAHGDVISFVMRVQDESFQAATRRIAKRFNLNLDFHVDPDRKRYYSVLAEATSFWEESLWQTAHVLEYLSSRGLVHETIRKFMLGFADPSWRSTTQKLEKDVQSALVVGLIQKTRSEGGLVDVFRNRVICPITNDSNVCGISARRLASQDQPKYLVSKNSPVYKKGSSFFGWMQAVSAIRKNKSVVLVEGNFDVMLMHQCSLENTIAPMGTTLTNAHIQQLKKIADTVILFLDGDSAGKKATDKAVVKLLCEGLSVRVVERTVTADPGDIYLDYGAEGLFKMVESCQDGIDYLVREMWAEQNRQLVPAKARGLAGQIEDPTNRALFIDAICSMFHISADFFHSTEKTVAQPTDLDWIRKLDDPAIIEQKMEELLVSAQQFVEIAGDKE